VEPCNTASAAVNRRKGAAVIAAQNLALYQRLVAIRPSKDISRQTLGAAADAAEKYRLNCSQFKPGQLMMKGTGGEAGSGRASSASPARR